MTTKSTKKPTTRRSPREKAADARTRAAAKKAAPPPKPAPTPDTAADTGNTPTTIGELADRYLESLRLAGKSIGTQFSYSIDLQLAVKHFGTDTPLTDITELMVIKFFEGDTVTKTRSGKPKAKPTVDKSRRVFRMALAWAAKQKLIAASPVPAKYASRKQRTASN